METSANIKDVYKIGRTIGTGSSAIVRKAVHRETKEKVAVKVFQKEKMS